MNIRGYNAKALYVPLLGSDFGIRSGLGRNLTGLQSQHAPLARSTPQRMRSVLAFFGEEAPRHAKGISVSVYLAAWSVIISLSISAS